MDYVCEQPRLVRIVSAKAFTSLSSLVGLVLTLLVCLEEAKVRYLTF